MDNMLKISLVLFVAFLLSMALDVAIVRQALGLLFLSVFPGYLFLRLLKIEQISGVETVVFSVATSIAILMFGGLLVNSVGSLAGIANPLSLPYLAVGITILFFTLFLFSIKSSPLGQKVQLFEESRRRVIFTAFFLGGLLFFGLIGAIYRNVFILAISLALIAVTFVLCTFFNGFFKTKIHPLVIAVVGVVILFGTALISNHIFGADVFGEFHVFRLTEMSGFWQPAGQVEGYTLTASLKSMLSVTILPNVLSALLGLDGELVFKIFYPLVLVLIPMSIYALCKRQLTTKVGLIAAFYFMSISIAFCGIEQFSINRQIVGYLFFFLSFFVIIEWKRFPSWRNRVLLFVFVSALAVSHYSLAFLFIFYIAILLVLPRIWDLIKGKKNVSTRVMTLSLFVLLVSIILFWNTFISNSPLNQLSTSINRVTSSFSQDFFESGARNDEGALSSLSFSVTSGALGTFHKILIYVGQALIGIGVLLLIVKPSKFAPSSTFKLVGLISLAILGSGFLIPNLFATLNTSRFYIIVLPFLSPFLVIGISALFDYTILKFKRFSQSIEKHRLENIVLKLAAILVVLTFVLQTGLVNYIVNDYPYSYSLDLNRKMNSADLNMQIGVHSQYFLDSEIAGAEWVYSFANHNRLIYADINSRDTVLASYALVEISRTTPILNHTMSPDTYIFLKYINVQLGLFEYVNQSDFASNSRYSCQIYSNGDSSIYFNP